MTNIRTCISTWVISIFGVLASFYAFQLIGCIASASADVPAEQAPAIVLAPGSLANQAVPWLLGALVGLKVLEMLLARVSPLTKTKLDDEAYVKLHAVNEIATEILTHVRTPTAVTSVVVNQPPAEPNVHTATTSPGTLSTITETP
jgi:hypothetical protein